MGQALVLGLGKSGMAAARLLHRQGWQVQVQDSYTSPGLVAQKSQLEHLGITICLGEPFNLLEPPPQLVVVSPGVPWDVPVLQKLRAQGVYVLGEMGLAWRSLCTVPWVGITGTNGKTTTTSLVVAILAEAGYRAPACGNIGTPACDLLGQDVDWVVAEISSFQIESSPEIAPQIGVWTTFTPDHLNRHYTLENYCQIKAHLLAQSQVKILNGDDLYLRAHFRECWSDTIWTSIQGVDHLPKSEKPGIYIQNEQVIFEGRAIFSLENFPMPGDHNRQNLLLAIAVANVLKIPPEMITQAMRKFPGVPHRLEVLGVHQGITYINDSKATNYDAAQVGLASMTVPTILLAGGQAKTGDDQNWLQTIQKQAVGVVLFGVAAESFAQRLTSINYTPLITVENLGEAVPAAQKLAQETGAKVILLSPACASFDQYPNFEARGDHFRQLFQDLLESD
ncbi:UDP-N-acetylmuramoyl-L-alanyl-D-glutamate synthetase [Gloeomargarita lithophora Alchichica-D10]|uniref:UDP-N-acetylmuramoylalanine--D-glutamate ligase n=1 Tax=Gloeomargarita lithophora Alchichica-D10 TaxID=1188229 RepID=A0A1J0ABD0_9CYAN|nr:UDP-N-acetylmuramoyl-L-alanine--D-glutamate ligase [Gloeomargarita lithophora]APB33221.1 UDP-N-acetylmuramoyl-L-alanyl-D-glutamate synthetase [Gloeomargarita lithophora Alchichica-D10]